LAPYFVLKTVVIIHNNRSFDFSLFSFSITYGFSLLRYKKVIKVFLSDKMIDKDIYCIKLRNVLHLCLYKYPGIAIKESFYQVFGIIKSMDLEIELK
jgi:hypothetical protein